MRRRPLGLAVLLTALGIYAATQPGCGSSEESAGSGTPDAAWTSGSSSGGAVGDGSAPPPADGAAPNEPLTPERYRALAAAYGTAEMIPFRFGNDWRGYHDSDPSAAAPTVWERPHTIFQLASNPSERGWYELGNPAFSQTEVGDFSSAMAGVGYVSDRSMPRSFAGIDSIYTYYQSRRIISQRPQVAWTYNNRWSEDPNDPGDGMDPSLGAGDANTTGLVALTRSFGNSEEATHLLAVYWTGTLVVLKPFNTAADTLVMPHVLPANLVPTAASVTSQSELALIPCWDVERLTGVLAVVALGEKQPRGSHFSLPWSELYPGFRNSGQWTFAKYLGAIDLPMRTPTEVEAVSDDFGWAGRSHMNDIPYGQGTSGPGTHPLSEHQDIWATFRAGGSNYDKYAHHGFALVASRYERKVAVVDLRPFFAKVEATMFGDFASFRATVVDGAGTDAGQWPYAFSHDASLSPVVVKTLEFNADVTAVSASLAAESKGLVATEDGVLHVLDMDGLQEGGAGAQIREIATLGVGRNVTAIGHVRHYPDAGRDDGSVQRKYWALSRGDKTATLLSFADGWSAPRVLKSLSDSRLVDPIGLDDSSNHGIQLDLLNVADYGARALHAYRYGVARWVTWLSGDAFGCGAAASRVNERAHCDGSEGTELFEYGGSYATPTGVWVVNGQNVQ